MKNYSSISLIVFAIFSGSSFCIGETTSATPASAAHAPAVGTTPAAAKAAATPTINGPTLLKTTVEQARVLATMPIGELDPFTGQAAGFQNAAHQLKLEKQKTAILNERLLQARALEDIMKTGYRGPEPRPGGPGTNRPTVENPVVSVQAPPATQSRVIAKRKPVIAHVTPQMVATPVVATPPEAKLVGLTTVNGVSYAVFQQDNKTQLVREGSSVGATTVGAIQGNRVMVNGTARQVTVAQQEVVVVPSSKDAVQAAAGAATAHLAVAPSAGADMKTLGLPTVPRGPQPLKTTAMEIPSASPQ